MDKLRWYAALLPPLSVIGAAYYLLSPNAHIGVIFAPALFIFVVVTGIDELIGDGDTVGKGDDEFFFRVSVLTTLVYGIAFVSAVSVAASGTLPVWAYVYWAIAVGFISGNTITLGHEFGHKGDRANQLWTKISLAITGYGHFTADHNLNHHTNVATPGDTSSAKFQQSIYAFAARDMPSVLVESWKLERDRLKRRGHGLLSWRNEILQSYALTGLISLILIVAFGAIVLPFIVMHHLTAWFALSASNYIQHYGLLRERRENGKFVPCEPKHSWNSGRLVSNLLLFNLQRHSDHHVSPMKPYQALQQHDKAPQLPAGYPACLAMALAPPLWFRVMNPKVMAWAGGDPSKIHHKTSAHQCA